VKDVPKKIFCLASTTQHDVPTNAEKQQLLVAGLGEKKVTLPGEGNANDVSVGLKETFPKLSDSAGYEFMHAKPVVTKTWTHNDPQRSTTTHNDPTMTHYDPTMIHNDPLQPHNDPTTTNNDPQLPHDPTTTPQRSQNYLQLQFCMTINNISYCLWIHHIFYYCKAFDPNPDLHTNRWDLKHGE
jgi:hypothetical protein